MSTYIPPAHLAAAFNCPNCGAAANQAWFAASLQQEDKTQGPIQGLDVAVCLQCRSYTLWVSGQLAFPDLGLGILPRAELPERVRNLFGQASRIASVSPSAACALLRLSFQWLCLHAQGKATGPPTESVDVAELGLSSPVLESLKEAKVIGSAAVPPGQIDLSDGADLAIALCQLVNLVGSLTLARGPEPQQARATESQARSPSPSDAPPPAQQNDHPRDRSGKRPPARKRKEPASSAISIEGLQDAAGAARAAGPEK